MPFSQIILPLPLPQSPKDCFIHLCLFCCLAYRVIVTIFLNSIYMCYYTVLVEKAMALHSSTLAWKILWTEEPGRLQSMGSLGVGHDWATSLSLSTFMRWRRKWQPTPVFLAWRIPGTGEPGGLPSMRSHRVRHEWHDLAAVAAVYI